jgi:hypothetical protein
VFKKSHRLSTDGKTWHAEHLTVYETQMAQDGLSPQELELSLAEFNLDMDVVLKADALKHMIERSSENDDQLAPHAASNASQQISALNSITTLRSDDASVASTQFFRPPAKPVDSSVSFAAMVKKPGTNEPPKTHPTTQKKGRNKSTKSGRQSTQQPPDRPTTAVAVSQISSVSTLTSSAKNIDNPSTISITAQDVEQLRSTLKADFDEELMRRLRLQELDNQQRFEAQSAFFQQMLQSILNKNDQEQSTTAQLDGGGQML